MKNLEKLQKIIGVENPNLENVLIAIIKTGEIVRYMAVMADNGKMILLSTKKHEGIVWELGKPLHLQSPETINFLWEILKE